MSRINDQRSINGQPPCHPSPTIFVTSLCPIILSSRTRPQPHASRDTSKNCKSSSASDTPCILKKPFNRAISALYRFSTSYMTMR
ncbi:hypothetical protein CVT25_008851 [Psilocybe cyanescens]|uniref:Uncharacterized protein n=1 Tax=Psilocybe cyanescens TaxID=93625 RepID=A0A409XAL1_PSICY|nr:hypothetical protein CVT25_008851 [Psilocybe cyanescens]